MTDHDGWDALAKESNMAPLRTRIAELEAIVLDVLDIIPGYTDDFGHYPASFLREEIERMEAAVRKESTGPRFEAEATPSQRIDAQRSELKDETAGEEESTP